MSSKFYTNVMVRGSTVLVREIVDGIPSNRKDTWKPTLYIRPGSTPPPGKKFTTIYGDDVYAIQPGSIVETKDFIKRYDGVSGFDIFGQLNFPLQYMHEYDLHEPRYEYLSVWGIDIETTVPVDENGANYFPTPENADGEVILITLTNMHTGKCFTFGTKGDYKGKDTSYTRCASEHQLFRLFLDFWKQVSPDIITGWNILGFDIPYIINRATKLDGEGAMDNLSPWGIVRNNARLFLGRMEYNVVIGGVAVLDYIDLYKKYVYEKQESYSLNHIAMVELGHTKVDHSEFADFNAFWQGDPIAVKTLPENPTDIQVLSHKKFKLVEELKRRNISI